MIDRITEYSIEEMKRGYIFKDGEYVCLICGTRFESGEIFSIDDRYFNAKSMTEKHIEAEHKGMLNQLVGLDKKYTSLTENQKELIENITNKMSDKEIAAKLGVSPSTIRHQRYVLREKAKQAKVYLALFELMQNEIKKTRADDINTVHNGAKMVDERYFSTDKDKENVIKNNLISLEPLVVKNFPVKEKKKLIILRLIIEKFEKGKDYAEKEVNAILKPIYVDYVLLRRYLIEYGFMDRTRDCKRYWRK